MLVWETWDLLEYLLTYPIYGKLPLKCRRCEYLKECRRPKSEGWKCYDGCLLLNDYNSYKYEGLPKGCWNCKYLEECRLPQEQGWKCKNGCRKIKEREEERIKGMNL